MVYGSVQGTVHHAGKSWQQELEVAGHIVSTVKKQNVFSSFYPFYTAQDPCPGNGPAYSLGEEPSHLDLIKISPYRQSQRLASQVNLDFVKLIALVISLMVHLVLLLSEMVSEETLKSIALESITKWLLMSPKSFWLVKLPRHQLLEALTWAICLWSWHHLWPLSFSFVFSYRVMLNSCVPESMFLPFLPLSVPVTFITVPVPCEPCDWGSLTVDLYCG